MNLIWIYHHLNEDEEGKIKFVSTQAPRTLLHKSKILNFQ